ncbi:MAG: arginine--tRNA ligase [Gammaproteobacteria bacterium]|nr:MAG: arginine--tRNA ligase [Gammaproteobacteria bacterium]
MTTKTPTIEQELSTLLGQAFTTLHLPAELGQVQRSQRPDLADYQCNGAMVAAKKYQAGNPFSVAENVLKVVTDCQWIDKITVVKPGFINIRICPIKLSSVLQQTAQADSWGIIDSSLSNTRVIIDSGGANVAKSMHVGHLRTAIIGEALRRIFLAKGYEVITDVHLGDWGTQMGMLIEGVRKRQPDLIYFDADYHGEYPKESPVTIQDLETIYPQESGLCKTDKAAAEKARQATAELQNGRPGYRALWRHFVEVSIATLKRDYAALNVHFDWWKGESDADPYIEPSIKLLQEKGVATVDQGALIVPILDDDGEPLMPPLMLRKSDGAVMYATTDIATLYERIFLEKANIILYVVDGRQQQHFRQVFAVADMMGMNANTTYEHDYFGTVNGKDGKPFKTRSGGVMKLDDLIGMATDEAKKKLSQSQLNQNFPQQEQDDIARKVAISALKFADLRNHRIKDYTFDLEKFSEFEGKTGPYLLMQVARMKSILRKAESTGLRAGKYRLGDSDIEKSLVLKLLDFSRVIDVTIEKRAPHFLCEHLYQLAQLFSSFYQQQHILNEADKDRQASLLALVAICLSQLEYGVNLLGIETLDRM